MNVFRTFFIAVGLLLNGSMVAQISPSAPRLQSLKIVDLVEPIVPAQLNVLGIAEGEVRIVLSVDADGKLADSLVIGYTRQELADTLRAVVGKWKFEPARLDGQPVGTTVALVVRFESSGLIVVSPNVSEMVEARLNRFLSAFGQEYIYRPCSLRELDRIPVPLVTVMPAYPQSFGERRAKGSVTVEFYINEQGMVRMPAVGADENAELAACAVDALRQWKFEPPTRRGRPVLVKASQRFDFTPKPQVVTPGPS